MKMEDPTVSKRKKDKHFDDEDDGRERKTKRRRRTRSRSYENRDKDAQRKRRRSRSRSPKAPVKQEKRREDAPSNDANNKKNVPERRAKETDMLNTRTGGAYIPPARLRMMQAQITDKSSVAYQRLAWEALKKSIHGHINKINVGNIGIIIKELLKENIVRGRGLLCRSVIQAQAASPTFTNVYAALVAAVNSRFPNIGELLLKRLVIQFKRGFKRNDKPICISSASFIAHLVNQRVAHEILALELLTLLVESPTDDSVEVAIAFLKECGQKLTEVSTKGVNAIFEMLRNILHEGQLDKRVQYMIEVMFQVWKDGFKDHPALIEELELVPEEEQFTHLLMLDDATNAQDILNVFKFDEKYEENEEKYKTLSKEILGSDAESGEEDGSEESGSGESEDEGEQEGEQKGVTIIDNTETNLVALRRTIYLTINSSLDFEECAHKLMKMQLKPGQEVELCHMFLDCCAEQRTYEKFYGLLAQRFCNINRIYISPFEDIFKDSYSTAHRLDTNRLRNVSKFFAHLLFTDSISWEVMECVKLNEEDTTSSSRIYIKILFQELAEYMGLKKLNDRLKDPTLQSAFSGIFPRDNPKNTRFSINFFTSIGLGGLTDELREHLKQMPKNIPAAVTDINVDSESSSSSSSSDSSSESSSSDSEEDDGKNKKTKSKKSSEKNHSKQNSPQKPREEQTHHDKNDKDKRWGHDGFYETYGEEARRYDRPERYEQNNFTRSKGNNRHDERESQKDDGRGNRYDRNNREMIGRQNDRNPRNSNETKRHRMNSENKREERERYYASRRNNTDNNTTEPHNTKDNSRYERPEKDRNDRQEKTKHEDSSLRKDSDANDKRQYKDQSRPHDHNSNRNDSGRGRRDNAREINDRGRVGDRNTENEKRDKDRGGNSRAREDDRYKDERIRKRNSEQEKRGKGYDRNERIRVNDQHQNEDRTSERNSEKESKDKAQEKNGKARQDDRSRDKKTEDTSNKNTKDRDSRADQGKRSVMDNEDRNGKNSKSEDKNMASSNQEDSRRFQEGSKSKDTEKRNQRDGKGRKNNKVRDSKISKKVKKTNKKTRDRKDTESSSSESSSSDSSSSDSSSSESENQQTGGRYWDSFDIEQLAHNNEEEYSKTPEIKEKRYDKKRVR